MKKNRGMKRTKNKACEGNWENEKKAFVRVFKGR